MAASYHRPDRPRPPHLGACYLLHLPETFTRLPAPLSLCPNAEGTTQLTQRQSSFPLGLEEQNQR